MLVWQVYDNFWVFQDVESKQRDFVPTWWEVNKWQKKIVFKIINTTTIKTSTLRMFVFLSANGICMDCRWNG